MSTSQEVNEFMESIAPAAPAQEQTPPVQEQAPPVQEQVTQPTAAAPQPAQTEQVAQPEAKPDAAPADNTDKQHIAQLEAEVRRLTGDTELREFESNLRRSTETYMANKQKAVEDAHKRNRELLDAGDVDKADAELRAFYTQVEQADNNMRNYVAAQRQQFASKRDQENLKPQYAQHLGQTHKLSAEDVALLAKFDGYTQDVLVREIIARNNREAQNEARLRELEASTRAQSGAFAPGGTTGAAAPAESQRPSDPMQAEVWDYMQSPIVPVGGR